MRKALVVGIDEYPWASLRGCVNDAKAIAGVLKTHGDGSPNFAVRLLTAPPATVNKAALWDSIEKLFEGAYDISLFYFSGHSLIRNAGGYVVTPDATRYNEGIPMDEILTLANRSQAKDKVIFLDCCHSGVLGNPAIARNNIATLSEGLSVLAASQRSESAFEVDGMGVFTSLLVNALQGGAADLRGSITLGSVYAHVDRALGTWDQRPVFKTNVTRFTTLRSISPLMPLEILRKICAYFPTPQAQYSLDPSYEFTHQDTKPENVAIMKDLQKFMGVGLVVPVGEEHMYFAAINSKRCRLTLLGQYYWRLVNQDL
jgi:hypothetical protein